MNCVLSVISTSGRTASLLRWSEGIRARLAASWVDIAAVIGILSLALPLRYLVGTDLAFLGLDASAIHKLFLIACTGPVLLRGGLRNWFNPVIVTASLLLLLGLSVSVRLPALTPMQSIQSYAALILGAYLFELKLGPRIVRWLVGLMPWVAVFNLSVALGFWLLEGRPFYRWFFGAFRLHGIGVPAMLSAIAVSALMFSLLASLRRPSWIWLTALNYLVVVWTGTRARAVEGAILMLGWAILILVSSVKEGRRAPRLELAVLVLAVPIAIGSYSPNLQERMGGFAEGATKEAFVLEIPRPGADSGSDQAAGTGDEVWTIDIGATGRVGAWSYSWEVFRQHPWFGNGTGAAIVTGKELMHPAFVQPHNEYLRLLVDGGIVGLSLILLGHVLVLRRLALDAENFFRRGVLIVAFVVLAAGAAVQNELSNLFFNAPFWLFVGILSGESQRAGAPELGRHTKTDGSPASSGHRT